jgi:hypothetical protein
MGQPGSYLGVHLLFAGAVRAPGRAALRSIVAAGERPSERWSLCFGCGPDSRARRGTLVPLRVEKIKSVLGSKSEGKRTVEAARRRGGGSRTLEKADVLSYRSRRGRQGQYRRSAMLPERLPLAGIRVAHLCIRQEGRLARRPHAAAASRCIRPLRCSRGTTRGSTRVDQRRSPRRPAFRYTDPPRSRLLGSRSRRFRQRRLTSA